MCTFRHLAVLTLVVLTTPSTQALDWSFHQPSPHPRLGTDLDFQLAPDGRWTLAQAEPAVGLWISDDGSDWSFERIDGTSCPGSRPVLDFDGAGEPAILWRDDEELVLRLSRRLAGTWSTEVVTEVTGPRGGISEFHHDLEFDAAGEPVIAYTIDGAAGSEELRLARQDAEGWSSTLLEAGGSKPSLLRRADGTMVAAWVNGWSMHFVDDIDLPHVEEIQCCLGTTPPALGESPDGLLHLGYSGFGGHSNRAELWERRGEPPTWERTRSEDDSSFFTGYRPRLLLRGDSTILATRAGLLGREPGEHLQFTDRALPAGLVFEPSGDLLVLTTDVLPGLPGKPGRSLHARRLPAERLFDEDASTHVELLSNPVHGDLPVLGVDRAGRIAVLQGRVLSRLDDSGWTHEVLDDLATLSAEPRHLVFDREDRPVVTLEAHAWNEPSVIRHHHDGSLRLDETMVGVPRGLVLDSEGRPRVAGELGIDVLDASGTWRHEPHPDESAQGLVIDEEDRHGTCIPGWRSRGYFPAAPETYDHGQAEEGLDYRGSWCSLALGPSGPVSISSGLLSTWKRDRWVDLPMELPVASNAKLVLDSWERPLVLHASSSSALARLLFRDVDGWQALDVASILRWSGSETPRNDIVSNGRQVAISFHGPAAGCQGGVAVAELSPPSLLHRWLFDELPLSSAGLSLDSDDESGDWPRELRSGGYGEDDGRPALLTVYEKRNAEGAEIEGWIHLRKDHETVTFRDGAPAP